MKAIIQFSALAVAWIVFGSLSVVPRAQAGEPAQAFVDGLCERGLYDYALEYLDRAGSDPLVPEEFKRKILYEQGITLVKQARGILDAGRQEEKLDAAQAKLSAFIKASPRSALVPAARNQLANVLMARGRMLVRRAKKLVPAQGEQQVKILSQARRFFDDARSVLQASQAYYSAALKERKKGSNGVAGSTVVRGSGSSSPTTKDRGTLRRQLLQSRLGIAEAMYEGAKTHPADSADYQKELIAAAEKYKTLYERNSRSLGGLRAHLWQGRCYQDLGRLDVAIGCYEDLILQKADLPVFRKLVSKAYQGEAECYIRQTKYDEAIRQCGAWLAGARGSEGQDPDWLAVEYQLALAHVGKGRSLKKGSAAAKRHIRTARSLVRQVSQWPNEFQQPAKLLYAELGPGTQATPPKTFDEAYKAATGAIDLMKSSQGVLQLARRNNPAKVPELQAQLAESRLVAFEYFRLALALADEKTDQEKVNLARYYLCYLNYDSGRYYDAAVLGEFLARSYPKKAHASEAAKIAMAAFERLYYRPDGTDKAFEAARLVEIADYITTQWPDQKESDDAYRMLINIEVRQGKFDRAEQHLAKISPRRHAAAQIQIGLGYWNAYLRGLLSESKVHQTPPALDALKRKARSDLEAGLKETRGAPATTTTASAALSLAQIYLETSEYEQAIRWLEDEQVGPLTLVGARSPVVDRDGFAEETYKAALRAYLSASPPKRQKALQAMDALETLASGGGDPKADEKLTKILIGLGRPLQRVIEELDRQGRAAEAASVARTFENILDRVSSRPTGNTWATRNWIAQTYYQLAAGLDDGGALTKQVKTYYGKAVAAYEAILEEAGRDKHFSPSDGALLYVKMRLAKCLRKMHKHAEALELIAGILAEKPNMLQAQLIAAHAYQDRGDFGEPKGYYLAIKGGHRDVKTGKNLIWGWGKLSRIAYRYPKYRGTFYEARYNMNLCRLQYAMKQSGERRAGYLRSARDDLTVMDLSYSDEAWIEWRPKFERLLKDVQRNMKLRPVGFEKSNNSAASKASAGGKTVKN